MPPSAAVLDASVLISGFLTEGPPRAILTLAEAGRFRMVLSAVILEETRRTLAKPKLLRAYRHSAESIWTFCDGMAAAALLVEGDRPSSRRVATRTTTMSSQQQSRPQPL
jgi:predicted nucleic acid-binding protein